MSSASFPSLELPLRASRWLQAAVLALGAAAALALVHSSLPWPAWLLAPLLTLQAWRTASRSHPASLCLGADGTARLEDGHCPRGSGREVQLEAVSVRGPLLVLGWRAGRLRQRHVFGPDTCRAGERRLLRLWWQRHRPDLHPLLPGVG